MSRRLQERDTAAQKSSSSSRRDSSAEAAPTSSRKRKVTVCADLTDDDKEAMKEVKEALGEKKFAMSSEDLRADISRCSTHVSVVQKERESWESLSAEVKAQCVKACVRLLIMKGTKHDNVNRGHVIETIKSINKAYSKHVNQIIIESRRVINKRFGYVIRSTGEFDKEKENGAGDRQTFFLTNSVDSPLLHSLLVSAEAPAQKAFRGFAVPVFLTLFTSPGRKASFKTLLANIRTIDPRFPESDHGAAKVAKVMAPVEGLASDFKSLIARMKSERYLVALKERDGLAEAQDGEKTEYTFGPRFHAEIGLRKCCLMYYKACDEVPDEGALMEFEEEDCVEAVGEEQ